MARDYQKIAPRGHEGEAVYFVVSERGVVGAERDLGSAAEQAALIAGQRGLWYSESVGERNVCPNPAITPERALYLSGLPQLQPEEVMGTGPLFGRHWKPLLEDAWRKIQHFFPTSRQQSEYYYKGRKVGAKTKYARKMYVERGDTIRKYVTVPVTKWQSLDGYTRPVRTKGTKGEFREGGLLRQNCKLARGTVKGINWEVLVAGLNLVPEASIFRGYAGGDPRKPLALVNPATGSPWTAPCPTSAATLCAGSTLECRSSCLAFSGQQTIEDYKQILKQGTTLALLTEPVAFVRLLVEAIRRFWQPGRQARRGRYIRLNVLSDVPWELVCPWLFKVFPGSHIKGRSWGGRRHLFYDYTKIFNRQAPSNYVLTYSYAGPRTEYESEIEFSQGKNVAVVFFHADKTKVGVTDTEIHYTPLPKKWKGRRVLDGDESDARPLDPPNSWVGLRFKPAKQRGGKTRVGRGDLLEDPSLLKAFVIRCYLDGGQWVTELKSSDTPTYRISAAGQEA